MSNINSFAEKIATNLRQTSNSENRAFAFDPTIIILIAQALVPLIQAAQKCMEAKDIVGAASSPTLLQKVGLRLNLRKTLVVDGGMSPREFAKNATGLVAAFIDTAKNSTQEEISALFEEVD